MTPSIQYLEQKYNPRRTSRYFEAAAPIRKAKLTSNPAAPRTKFSIFTPRQKSPIRTAATPKIRFAIWPSEEVRIFESKRENGIEDIRFYDDR